MPQMVEAPKEKERREQRVRCLKLCSLVNAPFRQVRYLKIAYNLQTTEVKLLGLFFAHIFRNRGYSWICHAVAACTGVQPCGGIDPRDAWQPRVGYTSRMEEMMEDMTPRQIVAELDKYIVGQQAAKRAVAIALRNRYRRRRLADDLRDEVIPKNILMIGPTGVGKTEIARRLATLARAPFVKVEATKFTEVGYVGRDVDSMVRDLVQAALRIVEAEKMAEVREKAEEQAIDRIVDLLQPRREVKPARRPARGENPMEALAQLFPQMSQAVGATPEAEPQEEETDFGRRLLR